MLADGDVNQGIVDITTAAPGPVVWLDGLLWRDPATGVLHVSTGGAWVPVSGGGGGGGNVPAATKPNQVLVSAGTTPFPWTPQDSVDSGRY